MAVQGAALGDRGPSRSNTVCLVLVVCLAVEGELKAGSYARRGNVPSVRTADGAFVRWNLAPGRGDKGRGANVAPGFGDVGRPDVGRPNKGACEC